MVVGRRGGGRGEREGEGEEEGKGEGEGGLTVGSESRGVVWVLGFL